MKLWHTIVNKSLLGIRTLLTKSRSHYQLSVDDTTENTVVKSANYVPSFCKTMQQKFESSEKLNFFPRIDQICGTLSVIEHNYLHLTILTVLKLLLDKSNRPSKAPEKCYFAPENSLNYAVQYNFNFNSFILVDQ